jgi:biotin-(acetyl-CoA carboxylase) ligase
MTIEELLSKLKTYWYLIICFPLLFGILSTNTISKKITYRASIGVGLSQNNIDFTKVSNENYDRQLNSLSEYLSNRFKSVEVQKLIIDDLKESQKLVDPKKPFYEVTNSTSGFINVSASLDSEEKAQNFLKAIKKTYQKIILTEKNQNELSSFQIKPMENFLEGVVEQSVPIQLQILPIFVGLLVAIVLVSILPVTKKIKS